MRFSIPLFVAKRYFFAKKSQKAINIISIITSIAVAVGTFALVVILSVFNGFEGLVIEMFNKFDPDIKITSTIGKTFTISNSQLDEIKKIKGVKFAGLALEENVLLKYGDMQFIGSIKGIDETIFVNSGIKSSVTSGNGILNHKNIPLAILGEGVADKLSINFDNAIQPLSVYYPNKEVSNINLDPSNAFNIQNISIGGTFSIQHEFDTKYVIVPLKFVQELLDETGVYSSLEINLNYEQNINEEEIINKIKGIISNGLTIKNKNEQHEFLYKIMRAEKWAVFFILLFILIIATFNLTGALTMLIIDKQQDIFIMKSFGMPTKFLKQIFVLNGLIITLSGILIGVSSGLLLCWLQIKFGLLQFNGQGSFVVDSYPVKIIGSDIIYISISVMIIGIIASIIPVNSIFKRNKFNTLHTE